MKYGCRDQQRATEFHLRGGGGGLLSNQPASANSTCSELHFSSCSNDCYGRSFVLLANDMVNHRSSSINRRLLFFFSSLFHHTTQTSDRIFLELPVLFSFALLDVKHS